MNYKEELERKGYELVRCIDTEERYRLTRGGEIIFDDSANEDFYGDEDTVANIFWEMLKETNEKEEKVEYEKSIFLQ